jgi:hypothetical protein
LRVFFWFFLKTPFPCCFFFSFICVEIFNLKQEKGLEWTLIWSKKKIWIKFIIYGKKLKTLVWNKITMQCEGEFGTTKYTTT